MKKFVALMLALVMLLSITACAESVSPRVLPLEGYDMVEVPTDVISYDSELVMTYIQEFANFTQVPRPSYNTIQMAEYLQVWAAAHGLESEMDQVNNVVIFVPATEGYEDAPVVAVQGHIDMVPAVDEGVEHDWDNDPLTLIWTENSVKADGTSLGADNGSGLAFMLTYMDYLDTYVHGPMRFIFTVDEEVGMLGAAALDPKYVEGVDYLINVDGGYGGAVISCAGGKYFYFSHDAEYTQPTEGSVVYALEFAGLTGGHSAGVGGGKANALVAMANALLTLDQAGYSFQIASFEGGNATNAIPSSSKAVIAINAADEEGITSLLDEFAKRFKDSYILETNYTFTYGPSDLTVEKVLTEELSANLVGLMSMVPNNIHTLLATASGTEASSNLGTLTIDDSTITFCCFMRSSSSYQAEQITLINNQLAKLTGFTLEVPVTLATWPMKAENKLADMAAQVYNEITGEEFVLSAIHAGVEGGEFAPKNEDMDIISTGVSGGSAGHTTAETMNFDKVEESCTFLTTLIQRLVEAG